MACIDKIYVTKEQFIRLNKWYLLMKDAKLIPVFVPFNQYNLKIDEMVDGVEYPVWNLDTNGDMWLLSNCPFLFVKEEIMDMYGLLKDEGVI